MNNFDWIMTVVVGSLASSGILLRNVSIADAALAIVVFSGLQWLLTWLAARSDIVDSLLKPPPELLTHKGKMLEDAMRKTRVTKQEIYAVLRENGITSVEDANWVILETNGKMSVIPNKEVRLDKAEILQGVRHNVKDEDLEDLTNKDEEIK